MTWETRWRYADGVVGVVKDGGAAGGSGVHCTAASWVASWDITVGEGGMGPVRSSHLRRVKMMPSAELDCAGKDGGDGGEEGHRAVMAMEVRRSLGGPYSIIEVGCNVLQVAMKSPRGEVERPQTLVLTAPLSSCCALNRACASQSCSRQWGLGTAVRELSERVRVVWYLRVSWREEKWRDGFGEV